MLIFRSAERRSRLIEIGAIVEWKIAFNLNCGFAYSHQCLTLLSNIDLRLHNNKRKIYQETKPRMFFLLGKQTLLSVRGPLQTPSGVIALHSQSFYR